MIWPVNELDGLTMTVSFSYTTRKTYNKLDSDHVKFKFNNAGSLSVNVSAATGTGRSEYVNAGEISGSTSLHDKYSKTVFLSLFAALICCFVFL